MPLSAQGVQNVKSILDSATAGGKTRAPGLVFIAVDKSGNTLVEHASGTRSIDSDEPMTMETTFWIASMTKIVATIACLQLTEQGKMPLDDPEFVAKYAPELAKKKVLYDGVNAADQQRPITMRMLLAHTAGFGYAFLDERVAKAGRPVGLDIFQCDERDILDSPLVNQPGSKWEYSVSSFFLARHIPATPRPRISHRDTSPN
jgi:CubicO group peptidase (beta-lactamase class C family)